MAVLTTRQRTLLSRYAHGLKPVVQIGQNGITEALEKQVDQTLTAHELIKIKFLDFKENKNALSMKLAETCSASVVRIIGNIAILYRPAPEPVDRQYDID
jgi:RNA-binding protein